MFPETSHWSLTDSGVECRHVNLDVRFNVVHGRVEGSLNPGSHLGTFVVTGGAASAVEAEPHDVFTAVTNAPEAEQVT
jgi:hypothetical protein